MACLQRQASSSTGYWRLIAQPFRLENDQRTFGQQGVCKTLAGAQFGQFLSACQGPHPCALIVLRLDNRAKIGGVIGAIIISTAICRIHMPGQQLPG